MRLAVNCGAVATPSAPDVAVAVAPLAPKLPLAPLAGAVNVTLAPATGCAEASTTRTARFVPYALPACALWGVVPLTAETAAGWLAGAEVSSTSCGALAPDSRLAYFFGLVDVAFISKLNVPVDLTIDVTSTLVHVFAVKLTAEPMSAPTAGRLP